MVDVEHLSLGSVAKRCNVSRTTIYRWIISGQLKAYSLPSGHFRVISSDLEAFCQSFGITQSNLPDNETSPRRRAVANKLNVLIADDHPDALTLFRNVVERYLPDAAIHEAVNGVDTCIAVGTIQPQVLILDIMMPGMDGFAVLQELLHRPELAHSRVVVVSAYEPFIRIEELARMNPQIVATLRKPTRVEALGRILVELSATAPPSSAPAEMR
ncbi:MAG: response regulator [Planctomycetota bacterium]